MKLTKQKRCAAYHFVIHILATQEHRRIHSACFISRQIHRSRSGKSEQENENEYVQQNLRQLHNQPATPWIHTRDAILMIQWSAWLSILKQQHSVSCRYLESTTHARNTLVWQHLQHPHLLSRRNHLPTQHQTSVIAKFCNNIAYMKRQKANVSETRPTHERQAFNKLKIKHHLNLCRTAGRYLQSRLSR